ncbi:MAG: hypothetical protein FWG03_04295 [Clostridiales bacterium]|nr:hypothetical protein [Clostridiales bacterium]
MKQFAGIRGSVNRSDYRRLLRTCGYGVPDVDRAIWCASNSVNMIIEDELQPYKKKKNNSITLNEMHIHTLPWPKELLLGMGESPVKMRVTLSYYIEPSPGRIGWKDKYKYASCGLHFDVNNTHEEEISFIRRISLAMRDEEEGGTTYTNVPERWVIGSQNRNVGSIHSDILESTASELAECNKIIVFPISGWWKMRPHLKCYDKKIRYSLIVSVETPETEIDFYNAIQVEIANRVAIKTEITAI